MQFPCSPSSNVYANVIHQRFKQTIVSARFGGQTEATKRMLSQLPISAQSYSSSPYLDLQLFSYDVSGYFYIKRKYLFQSFTNPFLNNRINGYLWWKGQKPVVNTLYASTCVNLVFYASEYTRGFLVGQLQQLLPAVLLPLLSTRPIPLQSVFSGPIQNMLSIFTYVTSNKIIK